MTGKFLNFLENICAESFNQEVSCSCLNKNQFVENLLRARQEFLGNLKKNSVVGFSLTCSLKWFLLHIPSIF